MMGKVNVKALVLRALRAARRDGFWKTFRAAFPSYVIGENITDEFDYRYGTDTAGIIPLWKLKIDSPNEKFGWRYETSNPLELGSCLKHILRGPQTLSFIDLGCGKGRMLIAARDLGFRKITGVEFAPELANTARANLAKAGVSDAVVVNADASEFAFPAEDFLVYLFNPFSDEVMKRVLENLRRVRANEGFIIYNNARCAELLDSSGFLTRIASVEETRLPTIIWSKQTPTG